MKNFLLLVFAAILTLSSSAQAAEEEKGFFGFFKKEAKTEAVPAAAPAAKAAVVKAAPKAKAPASAKAAAPAAPGLSAQNTTALQNRMANNKTMTDAEKTQLVASALKHFPPDANLAAKEYEQDVLRFEQIVNDPNMKVNEKKAEIEKYFSQPRAAVETVAKTVEPPQAALPQVEVKKEISAEIVKEAQPQAVKVEEKKVAAEAEKAVKQELKKEVKKEVKKASGNFAKKTA